MTRRVVPRAGDRTTEALREGQELAARDREGALGAGGRALLGINLAAATDVDVPHGLQRVPQGVIVTRCNGGANSIETVARTKDVITLKSTFSTVEVDLWVY